MTRTRNIKKTLRNIFVSKKYTMNRIKTQLFWNYWNYAFRDSLENCAFRDSLDIFLRWISKCKCRKPESLRMQPSRMHFCRFPCPTSCGSFVVTRSLKICKLSFVDLSWKIFSFSGTLALQSRVLWLFFSLGRTSPTFFKRKASVQSAMPPGMAVPWALLQQRLHGRKLRNSAIPFFLSCHSRKSPFCIGTIISRSCGTHSQVIGFKLRRASSLSWWI